MDGTAADPSRLLALAWASVPVLQRLNRDGRLSLEGQVVHGRAGRVCAATAAGRARLGGRWHASAEPADEVPVGWLA